MEKIYKLTYNNNVIALSEKKRVMFKHVLDLKIKEFSIEKVKKNKEINTLLSMYQDKMLVEETDGSILTCEDEAMMYQAFESEKRKLEDTINNLYQYAKEYRLKNKEMESVINCINTLSSINNSEDKLNRFLGVDVEVIN